MTMGRDARARAASQAAADQPVAITFPIVKVDAEKRLVEGIATAEVLDAQGEVVDYDTAKAVIAETWPGNFREMHERKAVGTGSVVEFDDANKAISVRAYISKGAPDTWEKVKDGTLKMFSIGGSAKERRAEKVGAVDAVRLFLKEVTEISLVDNGACPVASFALVKSADGTMAGRLDTGALVPAQPEDDDDPLAKAIASAHAAIDAIDKAKGKKQADDDDEKHRTAAGAEGKWYAGTDGKSFPITTTTDVRNAARALGRTKQDRAKVKANIIRIAYAHGLEAGLPDAWKKPKDQKDEKDADGVTDEEKVAGGDAKPNGPVSVQRSPLGGIGGAHAGTTGVAVNGPRTPAPNEKARGATLAKDYGYGMPYYDGTCCAEPYDIQTILSAIGTLESALASELREPGEAEAEDHAQIAMLRAAVTAAIEFLQSEFEEQFEDDGEGTAEEKAARAQVRKQARREALVTGALAPLFTTALTAVTKVGARHNKADKATIQKIHDHAVSLGADCEKANDDEGVAEGRDGMRTAAHDNHPDPDDDDDADEQKLAALPEGLRTPVLVLKQQLQGAPEAQRAQLREVYRAVLQQHGCLKAAQPPRTPAPNAPGFTSGTGRSTPGDAKPNANPSPARGSTAGSGGAAGDAGGGRGTGAPVSRPAATPAPNEKTTGATDVEKALAEQRAETAALQERLARLEAQPAPGGPKSLVLVDKQLGTGDSPEITAIGAATAIRVLEDLAKRPETTERERERIATEIIKLRQATGESQIPIRRGVTTAPAAS